MCDEKDLEKFSQDELRLARLSRRRFSTMVAGAGLTLSLGSCSPKANGAAKGAEEGEAGANDAGAEDIALDERMVSIATADGTMDAFFVHQRGAAAPAIIIWPDIAGLRDAFKMMARRLAASGYAVLVANPYYRNVPAPQFADFADFIEQDGFAKVRPWREAANAGAVMRDATALAAFLDAQGAVDASRGVGVQGYCMGGPFTIYSAAAAPDRIHAAASFHGGGLVGADETAPINLMDDINAQLLIAIAQNDDARAPDDKDKLRAAAAANGVTAEIEVYAADHGWTVYDSPAYDEAEGERAWARLLALYDAAL